MLLSKVEHDLIISIGGQFIVIKLSNGASVSIPIPFTKSC